MSRGSEYALFAGIHRSKLASPTLTKRTLRSVYRGVSIASGVSVLTGIHILHTNSCSRNEVQLISSHGIIAGFKVYRKQIGLRLGDANSVLAKQCVRKKLLCLLGRLGPRLDN